MNADTSAGRSGYRTPTFSSLAALAAVASRLNSGESPEQAVPLILETVRDQLRGDECALWLSEGGALKAGWRAGASLSRPDEIERFAASNGTTGDPGFAVATLESSGVTLGVLSLRRQHAVLPEERLLLTTLANFLAPFLIAAERSRLLAAEVEARTHQIEEQRLFTSLIIDSLPVGLYVIDREFRIQAWNKKRETGMQGVAREEAMGRPIFDILHRQSRDNLQREFDEVFATGTVQQFHTESSTQGELRVYRVSKIPMRLDGARVSHVITIGEDITEWKDAMDRMSQADKLAAVGQLAAGVMHEINNPLATIAACAESLALLVEDMKALGYAMNKQFAEYLTIIESEVQRCKRIVDELLEFSHPRVATKEHLELDDVIDHALFLVKHHARFKRITVERDPGASNGGVVSGNRDQLVQVFMALFLNAVDAMGDKGRITVRTRTSESGENIVAEVIDEGHGIPRGEFSKIFEPFYTTKAPGRGTGLGLSICYAIVTEHNGRLEVESTPGAGSLFRVVLPQVKQ
jgi:two-component system NtrC family sensor kinase